LVLTVREFSEGGEHLNDHPTPAELEGLILSRLSPELARFTILHLLRGCRQCQAGLANFVAALFCGEPDEEYELSPEKDASYDAAIDRAFQGITLVEVLLERSWALRYKNPSEMVRLAEAAAQIAGKLRPERHGAERVANVRFRALTELGNAYRVSDDLGRAREALDQAAVFTLESSVDERLAARYFDVQASLFSACRLFELATSALLIAHAIYQRLGDEHLAGRCLISLGISTGYSGEPEDAIHLVEQGLASINEEREPDLVFLALHNQARLLVDCGRHRDARLVLWELKKRGLDPGGRVNELKVHWLEGQIFAATEDFERAERALSHVKEGFAEADLPYKSALAGLELGAVWLRQGRLADSEKVVLEAVNVFIALQIRREVMTAVLMLKKAYETRGATAALVESVADFLRRAEDNPDLHFDPRPLR
jgi:tetratricopeptide (TPR) repeat protein